MAKENKGSSLKLNTVTVLTTLMFIVLSIIINAVIGKYLWNNVLVEVVSGVKKVSMKQMILLHVLFSILICRC